ncbi:hypothetical protein ACFQ1S_43620, partial [Kibdelosporangium lantanae]
LATLGSTRASAASTGMNPDAMARRESRLVKVVSVGQLEGTQQSFEGGDNPEHTSHHLNRKEPFLNSFPAPRT